jgi:hypothetical protein
MRLEVETLESGEVAVVTVHLSLRNLLTLVSKVRREGSARTLLKQDEPGGPTLIVTGEPDLEHYGSRDYPPGPMHPLDDPARTAVR